MSTDYETKTVLELSQYLGSRYTPYVIGLLWRAFSNIYDASWLYPIRPEDLQYFLEWLPGQEYKAVGEALSNQEKARSNNGSDAKGDSDARK